MSEPIRAALEELVACKDLKESINDHSHGPSHPLRLEYYRRQPLAWKAARDILAAPLQQETDKDGERYRWLRCDARILDAAEWSTSTWDSPEALDITIDAAIAALPQKDSKI